jgi:hypothetical protein
MTRFILLLFFALPIGAFGQNRTINTLIDIVPKADIPYCTEYTPDDAEKFKGDYPKNKLMATMEDTTAIEHNVIFAELLDRDAQLRLDSGIVRNHLLRSDERLLGSDSHSDFFAYFGEAFVLDQNAFYGIIIEKVMVNEGKLSSEKYFCTMTRDGKLIDKISILKSNEKDADTDLIKKACVVNKNELQLISASGKTRLFLIDVSGRISEKI